MNVEIEAPKAWEGGRGRIRLREAIWKWKRR